MCDTIVALGEGERSFFAKNSDRDPGEPQLLYYSRDPGAELRNQPWLERREKYADHSFHALQRAFRRFQNPYGALISRPSWMWGAEMGVNEHGVSIGNEAVFSRQSLPEDGLLGMDILRLALHNSKGAREAVELITGLLEEIPQGGDGGYNRSLKYHNSFLLKDRAESWVLETAGTRWASRKVQAASISNAYTIRGARDGSDPASVAIRDFKARFEAPVQTFRSRGNSRQRYTSSCVEGRRLDLAEVMGLLRTHAGSDPLKPPRGGPVSVCMHPGRRARGQTTASLVVDYQPRTIVVWFTGSPNPCVSLFKPMVLQPVGPAREDSDPRTDPALSLEYARAGAALSGRLVSDYRAFGKLVRPIRDEYERGFIQKVYDGIQDKSMSELCSDCRQCAEREPEYRRQVEDALSRA